MDARYAQEGFGDHGGREEGGEAPHPRQCSAPGLARRQRRGCGRGRPSITKEDVDETDHRHPQSVGDVSWEKRRRSCASCVWHSIVRSACGCWKWNDVMKTYRASMLQVAQNSGPAAAFIMEKGGKRHAFGE